MRLKGKDLETEGAFEAGETLQHQLQDAGQEFIL